MSQEETLELLENNKEQLRKKYLRLVDNQIWINKSDEGMARNIVNKIFNEVELLLNKEMTTSEIAEKLNLNPKSALMNLHALWEGGYIKQRKITKTGKRSIILFKWSI